MPVSIDQFIKDIKVVKPFAYEKPIIKHFMFSYDMSVDTRKEFTGDIRQFIVALLHKAGATEMNSYIETTMYFDAHIPEKGAFKALEDWKKLFSDTFGKGFTMMIDIAWEYTNKNPISTQIPHEKHTSTFNQIRDEVINKFKLLPKS